MFIYHVYIFLIEVKYVHFIVYSPTRDRSWKLEFAIFFICSASVTSFVLTLCLFALSVKQNKTKTCITLN